MQRRFIALLVCCASLIWAGSDSAEAVFRKAAEALSNQEYKLAERGFLAVLKLEPRNIGALGNLGVVYTRMRRFPEAIEVYKRALAIVPGEKFLSTNLGLAYVQQEQYSAALPIFAKLAVDRGNRQARELLATCDLALGRYGAALAVLKSLDDPGNPGVLYLLGVTYTRLKRTAEAHESFERMMAAASPAQANFLMGKASYETERFADAVSFFRKALESDPATEGAHRELGKSLISLREDEAAETELRLAGAEDWEALYYLGALLSHARPEEASPILAKARERNPGFWGPLYYLGRIAAEQGRINEAIPLLESAAKLNPDESAIYYQLGRALMKAGRAVEARVALAKVKDSKKRELEKEATVLGSRQVR